ncbi:MAG TPA: Clp protease N-terminal domain-containing protein [Candidatus Saccharimonadales bacterium]|nr:Clp protease N-terminal domain-containing protein [Candidatus Saccharimonadales bacterium]
MFERFTERARQVIVLAKQEAERLKHNYVGTEHILLGLFLEEQGLAARVLRELDVELSHVRLEVEGIAGRTEPSEPGREIALTPRSKKVIELALREALILGHNYIGPEHILLGLVHENGGVAARILYNQQATPEKIRERVLSYITKGGSPEELALREVHLRRRQLKDALEQLEGCIEEPLDLTLQRLQRHLNQIELELSAAEYS